jgi:hypothetical protein
MEVPEISPSEEAISPEEPPDWIQEIEESEIAAQVVSEELVDEVLEPEVEIEEQPNLEPQLEIEEAVSPTEIEVEAERIEPDLEESFDWLEESAREITPEPELEERVPEPTHDAERVEEIVADIEEPLDDAQIDSFLESLAAREDVAEFPAPIAAEDQDYSLVDETVEEKLIEEHIIPEELDESLVWLEQLAGEEPVEEFQPPIFVDDGEGEDITEVPDWLEEVAEKPEDLPGVEPIPEIEESPAEPLIPEADLSSMETIISKRPVEELIKEEEIPAEIPDETAIVSDEFQVEIISSEEPLAPIDLSAEPTDRVDLPEPTEEISQPVESLEPEWIDEAVTEEVVTAVEEAEPSSPLETARTSMERGDIGKALSSYAGLIDDNSEIDAVIEDLRRAIDRTPHEPMLWQTLGDALMKAGNLSDAIDAYRRGMEAL